MSHKLKVADGLNLPVELAARTQCIFAQKGAGKTYAAGVMAEEMLAARVQVCILDPTGVWWGLQSTASGDKSPYEVIVMGGGHADVPLEPDAGEIVANFLVETGQSVVLDVSQFESQAAQDRFALALATRLYRLKAHDKANIHVFMDEADQFCPMKPQHGQEKLLHAWDLIVRLGRSRGLGLTAISQRPAVVHTNIRNNVDLLTCLRVTGPHDFKALREWTGIHATAEQAREFLESVPTLADGEAFFWSPAWLRIFQRAKVRTKHTFDSSRTPKPGERAVEPKARRAPDLSKLTEQIRASVQRAKESDPKELKRVIADLRKQLADRPAETVEVVREVEVPVLKNGQLERTERVIGRLEVVSTRLSEASTAAVAEAAELKRLISPAFQQKPVAAHRPPINWPAAKAGLPPAPGTRLPPRRQVAPPADGEFRPNKTQQRILDALAWYESLGNPSPSLTQVGAVALIDPTGGYFSNTVGPLSAGGLVVRGAGELSLTDAGRALANQPESVGTLAEYHDVLRRRVRQMKSAGGKTVEMLDVVIGAGGESMTTEQVGQAVGIDHTGGYFSNTIGPLSTAGLITRRAGLVTPTRVLFPDGLTAGA